MPSSKHAVTSRKDNPNMSCWPKTTTFCSDIPASNVIRNLNHQDCGDFLQANPQFDLSASRAAVLIALFHRNGQLHVLLTKRSETLRTAPGQVSFPGGKRDATDRDDIATALRETEEEIGLPSSKVRVLCRLPPLFALNKLVVTPVVALVPNDCLNSLTINEAEVDNVFSVPLAIFLSDECHRGEYTNWPGRFERIHFFQWGRKNPLPLIFGLTAYMCICVACIVYDRDPDFPMEITFDRKDLEKGFVIAFSVETLASHMNVYKRQRNAMSGVLAPPKAKL